MQLKATSKQAYYGGQLKGIEFLDRYPTKQEFSAAHAGTGIDFDPAVWKSSELQKILCDLAKHDAYVRGNAWSTARQMLYAIRHYNVRHQGYDILKGKPGLWQLMDELKKISAFGGVPSGPACSPVGILPLWLGAFGKRVCWWDVGLLVLSAFAGGKLPCWWGGVLLVKRALLAKQALLAFAGQTRFAGPNANIRPNADCRPGHTIGY